MYNELKNKLNEIIRALNKIGTKTFEYKLESEYFYSDELEKRTYIKSDWEDIEELNYLNELLEMKKKLNFFGLLSLIEALTILFLIYIFRNIII